MISLLVAYDKNRVIGTRGKIPWELNSERRRFKEICKNRLVIMGRKTFEEIGKPLPYCTIAVVSKTMKNVPEGCLLFAGLEEAINNYQSINYQLSIDGRHDEQEILIAGGGEIYKQALPLAEKIYATEIDGEFEGDVFFPELDDSWVKVEETLIEDDLLPYKYVTYVKNF